MNLPVQVKWPPLLTRMPMSGQLYAISGSTWIPVPDDTVSADLPKYMTWERAQSLSEPSEAVRWTVKGSKGATYRVEALNGSWRCSCKGYQYRRSCRHIEKVKRDSVS